MRSTPNVHIQHISSIPSSMGALTLRIKISPADAQPLSDASQDRDWSPCPCPWLLRVLSILKSDTHAVAASKCHRRLSAGGSPLCPRRKLAFMDEGRELLRHIRLLRTMGG